MCMTPKIDVAETIIFIQQLYVQFMLPGNVMSPDGSHKPTGIFPSIQRIERKERSRQKKVIFGGKKERQCGDGKD